MEIEVVEGKVRVDISATLTLEQLFQLLGKLVDAGTEIQGHTLPSGVPLLLLAPNTCRADMHAEGIAIGFHVSAKALIGSWLPVLHTAQLAHQASGAVAAAMASAALHAEIPKPGETIN